MKGMLGARRRIGQPVARERGHDLRFKETRDSVMRALKSSGGIRTLWIHFLRPERKRKQSSRTAWKYLALRLEDEVIEDWIDQALQVQAERKLGFFRAAPSKWLGWKRPGYRFLKGMGGKWLRRDLCADDQMAI